MKKISIDNDDQDIPEIKFSPAQLATAVRGKYLDRINQGSNIVVLRPEIQKIFSTSEAVNEAPASLITLTAQTQALTTLAAAKKSARKPAAV